MRIKIVAVGRLKRAPEAELSRDYAGRIAKLGRQVGITGIDIVEVPESGAQSADRRKSDEASAIYAKFTGKPFVVALDEHGKSLSSVAFSKVLSSQLNAGTQEMCFVIGGPDGLDASLIQTAHKTIQLGAMTWPHRLVRVMLTEQIYRAVTILTNHPYHRA
ncbi:MAG: 23S rRNA (pseudouridine(1915)-N(3))-methyltransferase RlmH [Hyphomicrobiales bacterium]